MIDGKIFLHGIVLIALLGTTSLQAGPIDTGRHPHPENAEAVHEAEHAVDEAWEIYHGAALGGTIASPTLQTEIEQHLHEARTFTAQAQEAAERGDKRQVECLVNEVKVHTAKAIEGSKEQKE